jgi:hypothetical protein
MAPPAPTTPALLHGPLTAPRPTLPSPQFCLTYKRTTEFRRLCDIVRNHLSNLLKYRDQGGRDRTDLKCAHVKRARVLPWLGCQSAQSGVHV